MAIEMCFAHYYFLKIGLIETHAIFASCPLIVAILSVIILKEKFGWRRWFAIILGLIGISNGLANVLGSSTWAEIYGVKHIGSIKALTTALMVFSTAFGTALFGILIDNGFSIEQIAVISFIYILVSLITLFLIRNRLNPKYT